MSGRFPPELPPSWRKGWGRALAGQGADAGGLLARIGGLAGTTLALVVLMAAEAAMHLAGPEGGSGPEPDWLLLVRVGVLWSLAVAAASRLGGCAFAVAGLWLGWQGVALMGPWTGTPVVALPVGWLVVVAFSLWCWQSPGKKRQGLAGWLGAAMGAGVLLAGPSGWSGMLHLEGRAAWTGQLLFGIGVAALGIRGRARWRSWAWTEPTFGRVLAGSAVVMAGGLAISARRDLTGAAGWAMGEVEALAGWMGLGWFMIAGAAGVVLVGAAEWLTRQMVRGVTLGPARPGLPLVWLAVTVLEWSLTHLPEEKAAAPGWLGALAPDRWSTGWNVLSAHAWLGVVAVVLGIGFVYQGRDTVRMLLRVNALWLAAVPALWAVAPAMSVAHGVALPVGARLWGGAALVLAGTGWIVLRMWRETPWGQGWRLMAPWAGLACVLGGMVALRGWDRAAGEWKLGPAAVLGLLHLTLPVLVHRWWTRGRKGRVPMNLPLQAALVLAGAVVVLPMLQVDAGAVPLLGWAPVGWTLVLLWVRWSQPQLDIPDGALAGALLGVSTTAAWCRPDLLLPAVPLVPWLNIPLDVLSGPERPFLEPLHFSLLLLLGGAGAVMGALVFRRKPGGEFPLMPLLVEPAEPSTSGSP